ncbi:DUF6488 family protein [Pseudoalteromonas sp. bablab_jr011]|uniref:DUF6488 family protein n=1 Tax=Pseudoalteromonas sp. bablab_jr011 TaxID=2755062 RepID=UPI0018F772A3|nr:DUF6488 family protein [Pseudoalteromonas sp. bablab_jr011]
MNRLFTTALICIALVSVGALAHSGHDLINDQKAMNIAAKSIKKMTFKDYGFEVGKLDASWKEVANDKLSIVHVEEGYYVVKVENNQNEKNIFFKIAKTGELLDVKSNHDFE